MYDLAKNLFAVPRNPALVRAKNINTIDEVPDSDWFTNRILSRPVSIDEAVKGPDTGNGPAPGKLIVTRAKQSGVTPGFTSEGQRRADLVRAVRRAGASGGGKRRYGRRYQALSCPWLFPDGKLHQLPRSGQIWK